MSSVIAEDLFEHNGVWLTAGDREDALARQRSWSFLTIASGLSGGMAGWLPSWLSLVVASSVIKFGFGARATISGEEAAKLIMQTDYSMGTMLAAGVLSGFALRNQFVTQPRYKVFGMNLGKAHFRSAGFSMLAGLATFAATDYYFENKFMVDYKKQHPEYKSAVVAADTVLLQPK